MSRLLCSFCSQPPTDDEAVMCPCGGKYIDSRIRYEREQEEAWAVECAWEEYHTSRQGRIELPAATPNYLRIKQAG